MKSIRANILPFMLLKVTEALHEIRIRGTCPSGITCFDRERNEMNLYQSRSYIVGFTPKIRLEIICNDNEADSIVKMIQETAITGRNGDQKIIITERACVNRIKILSEEL